MSTGKKWLAALASLLAVAALLVITWKMGDTPPQELPLTTGAAVTTVPGAVTQVMTTAPPDSAALQSTAPPATTVAETTAAETTTGPGATAPPQTSIPATEAAEYPVTTAASTTDEGQLSCTLIIRCDSLLANLESLAEEKRELVPESGLLLEVTAPFYTGDSVFNVLSREVRRAGLHLEYTSTPGYQSVYIQGIGNLYQYDCGALSGWVYAVNGEFPGYGCSLYELAEGDIITFAYTCDLGVDVGGNNE